MKLTFIGATQTVTGSKTLIEINKRNFLIDCGLYQENLTNPQSTNQNIEDLKFLDTHIDGIILTHAHLDHSGLLPYLYKKGFRGPIYCTKETAKLTRIILEDSAELLKNEVPSNSTTLYSPEDAQNVISLFRPVKYNESFEDGKVIIEFFKASHILGAAFVRLTADNTSIVFSGDLGRFDDLYLGSPEKLVQTDYLVLESTYGSSIRESTDHMKELKTIIEKTISQKSTLLISSFALHRAQYLTYLIKKIFFLYPELKIPFFLNSPMMEQVFFTYLKFKDTFKEQTFLDFSLTEAYQELNFLDHFWDIEERNNYEGPQIIIASSGMLTGGRIWSHLKTMALKEKNILFLPGFQAVNTPGHKIIHGEKLIMSPEQEAIEINCEIIHSSSFSSHADFSDFQTWMSPRIKTLKKVFLLHGEDKAKTALKKQLELQSLNIITPLKGESYTI